MAIVASDQSERNLIDRLLNGNTGENLLLKLFKNDVTPGESTVVGDFTEADFSGYAAKTLTNSSWAAATTDGGGSSSSSYAEQTFTPTADPAQDIYGYYIVGATSGKLMWAERFSDAPRNVAGGDDLKVTPKFGLA